MLLVLVAAGSSARAAAQTPHFESGVRAVEVYASVTDARGEPITGLVRDRFAVREDGAPRAITTFAEGEFPLSIAVAVDRSWSMAGTPLSRAKDAARELIAALRPADRAMIVAVSGRVEAVTPLSTDRAEAQAALAALDPWSTTALHDAIVESVELVQAGSGRRALVLVSDGIDRYSTATAADVVSSVRAADVLVYPVALAARQPPLFSELASLTGGRSFQAPDGKGLAAAMRAIVDDLHHQYLLGYSPPPREGASGPAWRSIEVTVDVPGARVRARRGYVD